MTYIDLFLQGERAERFRNLVSSYDHVMRGNMPTVKIRSEEMGVVSSIMDRILTIGTVMPSSLYLTGGRIRAEYRFHASDLRNMTVLAGDILQMRNGMEIVTLGPDPGGISALDAVNDRISLSVVGFDTYLPDEIRSAGITEAFFEVSSEHGMKDALRSIAVCQASHVPDDSGIYHADISSPFINMVRNGANEAHIPRAGTLKKVTDGILRAFAFMPRSLLKEYLDILFSASRKLPDSHFSLSYVGDYRKGIWEWI
ncbi:MAG: hypothetical protein M1454_04565 [Candidatus Thermoplasmatota archaeon]|nr:hypothetical protein [Candidatus Thermoplasmatota archaeon]